MADICIITEGSYPYYYGGVSEWVHQLIKEHHERTFHVLALVPIHPDLTMLYQFPKNVIGHTVYIVQDLPLGSRENKTPSNMFEVLKPMIKGMIGSSSFKDFEPSINFFRAHQKILGKRILSESMSTWNFFLELYQEVIPSGPFKAYFGTMFTLTRSIYSMLLPELPQAKLFHSVCTGYAGFLLYRAKKEKRAPCLLTEHGIYSNERRIEIAVADWIAEVGALDLDLEDKRKTLKDFWLNAFFSLAHACYTSCEKVISTFDGNQEIQLEGGANTSQLQTIVHGIDLKQYADIRRIPHPPTAAFIGRVVPIKDVKTFIRACKIVHDALPHVRLYILGPTDADSVYFEECKRLIDLLDLRESLKMMGKVNVKEYLPEIDLIVLTSISEAQPLVILEAGAVGIPAIATNVGACRQLLYGGDKESPPLGQGGIVTPLVNPEATAAAMIRLLTDTDLYNQCSEAIAKRVAAYYQFDQQHAEYRKLYQNYLHQGA